MVTIKKIKELRAKTHVSLGKCKQALEDTNGNVDEAIVVLQKMGLVKLKNKARRETSEGYIYSYDHNGMIGVLVEVNCETSFAAQNELFKTFCETLALQVASMNPQYLISDDIPTGVIKEQRDIFKAQVSKSAPQNRIKHIINGKMKKWYSNVCLMEQKSVVVSGNQSIEQLRAGLVMQISENVIIKRFVRWEINK